MDYFLYDFVFYINYIVIVCGLWGFNFIFLVSIIFIIGLEVFWDLEVKEVIFCMVLFIWIEF